MKRVLIISLIVISVLALFFCAISAYQSYMDAFSRGAIDRSFMIEREAEMDSLAVAKATSDSIEVLLASDTLKGQ